MVPFHSDIYIFYFIVSTKFGLSIFFETLKWKKIGITKWDRHYEMRKKTVITKPLLQSITEVLTVTTQWDGSLL